jgi:hypothetical protein
MRFGAAATAVAATAVIAGTGVLSAGAASDRATALPSWSAKWLQANPGQPLVVRLTPGKGTCFVGLHGPNGARPVGWRFQPGGHRLTLTLLTHADAEAGQWVLRASCQGPGAGAHAASVLIAVPAPGGSGPLAAHGDMRVGSL